MGSEHVMDFAWAKPTGGRNLYRIGTGSFGKSRCETVIRLTGLSVVPDRYCAGLAPGKGFRGSFSGVLAAFQAKTAATAPC